VLAFAREAQDDLRNMKELVLRMVLTVPIVVIGVALIATVAGSGLALVAILVAMAAGMTAVHVAREVWVRDNPPGRGQ
jgi:hypothetical protein